ncbi:hypothetical protein PJM33_29475, partial [Mycobacterium kansasii]
RFPMGAPRTLDNLRTAQCVLPLLAETLSECFNVFSVKNFPGMRGEWHRRRLITRGEPPRPC